MGIELSDDKVSLIKWALGLKAAAAAGEAEAKKWRALAMQAEQEQPTETALIERLRAQATRYTAAFERMSKWYETIKKQNEPDFRAYFTPRHGSLHREARSDTRRAFDGN
jgi:hypothetical protein